MSEKSENNNQAGAEAGANSVAKAGFILPEGKKKAIFGVKLGMSQVFDTDGNVTPVTVIELKRNVITQVKTPENDGYSAVQVGVDEQLPQRLSKAEKGHFKASGAPGFRHVQEVRLESSSNMKVGHALSSEFIKAGDLVDVSGVSKGKGFQGVMKRHNFSGGAASHGASVCHRAPGSIGNRADPARVFPGKKMAGHMGNRLVTTQNLKVVEVNSDQGLLLVMGAVPGPKNGLVRISTAAKA